jgi:hypothetical protein
MQWLFALMNGLENGSVRYSKTAYEKLKHFIMAISQKSIKRND